MQQLAGVKRRTLPEYVEAAEVRAHPVCCAESQRKAADPAPVTGGLRVSETLAVERTGDLSLVDGPTDPTDPFRQGRQVDASFQVHPELQTASIAVLNYDHVGRGKIITASRSTAWRWEQTAVFPAEIIGALPFGRRVGTHTFRHG